MTKRARNAWIIILYWFKFKILRRKSKLAWKRRIKRKQQSGRHSFDSNAFTRTSQRGLLVHSHTFLSSMKAHKLISRIVWILTRMFLRHISRKRASRSIRSLKILQKHFDAYVFHSSLFLDFTLQDCGTASWGFELLKGKAMWTQSPHNAYLLFG